MPFFVTEVKKGFTAIANALSTFGGQLSSLRTDTDIANSIANAANTTANISNATANTARSESIVAARLPGLTGDVLSNAGTNATTLATVNSNVGVFGNATHVGAFTVDAKGRTTAASNVAITPAWTAITSKPTTLTGFGVTDAEDFMQSIMAGDVDAISYAIDGFNFSTNIGRRAYLDNAVANTTGWTYTRTGDATSTTLSGNVVTFAAGAPRITDRGILTEEARTNLLLWSRDFSNAAWSKSNATISGTTRLTATGSDRHICFQSFSYVANTAIAFSALFAKGSGFAFLHLCYTSSVRYKVTINLAAGTSAVSTIGGAAATATVENLGSFWRVSISGQNAAGGTGYFSFGLATALSGETYNASDEPTFAADGQFVDVDWTQYETGSFATSPILTTTVAVTRPADIAGYTKAASYQGTWIVHFRPTVLSAYRRILSGPYGGNSVAPLLLENGTGGRLTAYDGNSPIITTNACMVNTINKAAISYNGTSFTLCLNGGTPASSSGGTSFATQTQFYFGGNNNGAAPLDMLNGVIEKAFFYPYAMSSAEMVLMTQLALNFTSTLPAGITFSRSGAGTSFTAAGGVTSFATGVARITDKGLLIEPARTNVAANTNLNPANTTGISLIDTGTGASVAIVTDATELASIGLTGNVYRLIAGTSSAFANLTSSGTLNTNPHVLSVYARGGSGALSYSSGGISHTFTANTAYRRVVSSAEAPSSIGRTMLVRADTGQTVYFILHQVEEGSTPTSPIFTTGTAATRGVDVATIPVPTGKTIARVTYGANTKIDITGLVAGSTFDLVTNRPWVGVGNEIKSLEWLA